MEFIKHLTTLWKWKLMITVICTVYFSLPVISNLTLSTAIIMFVVLPILMWLSISFGLYHYSIEIKRKIKN